jgi:flagellar biosynthetic protein FliR
LSIFDPLYLLHHFLVFVRIVGLFTAAPFFQHTSIPVRVRILLAAVMAYGLAGFVPGPLPLHATEPIALLLYVAIEALTGIVLGLAGQFVFWSIRFAGDYIGFQMALSISQAISPADGTSSNPMSNLIAMIFLIVFLILDGHLYVLRALHASFDVIPLAGANLTTAGPLMLTWAGELFVIGLRLSAPFVMTLFLLDMTLGIFARVTPQTEIFSQSISLKLLVGIGLSFFYVQNFIPIIPEMLNDMSVDLMAMLEAIMP